MRSIRTCALGWNLSDPHGSSLFFSPRRLSFTCCRAPESALSPFALFFFGPLTHRLSRNSCKYSRIFALVTRACCEQRRGAVPVPVIHFISCTSATCSLTDDPCTLHARMPAQRRHRLTVRSEVEKQSETLRPCRCLSFLHHFRLCLFAGNHRCDRDRFLTPFLDFLR